MKFGSPSALRVAAFACTLPLALGAGCKTPQAYGERNHLILRTDTAVWSAHEPDIEEILEPRVYTVRPERAFELTAVSPLDPAWAQLRQWQQVLIFGNAEDPLVRDLLRKTGATPVPWQLAQREDIWARDQVVSVLVLPPTIGREEFRARLRDLRDLLDRQYREWVRARMFASGTHDSLMQALRTRGFTVALPRVYEHAVQDSFFLFRNALPDPGTLLRSLLVTWVPTSDSLVAPETLRNWRERIDEKFYEPPQDVAAEGVRFDAVNVGSRAALEMRGVWTDRSEFPAAGPFIARAVSCPAQRRLYYMDAWLYAPGKDKYPYVVQLETLLDSFRCAEETTTTNPARTGA